jgi:polar amino acid transport system permease protein
MQEIAPFLPRILEGVVSTMMLAAASILLAGTVAILLGGLWVSRSRPTRFGTGATVELVRGTSVLVQLFWVYYALPLLPGGPELSPIAASVLVLGLNGGAYGADVVRSGLRSVPTAQSDATRALGLPPRVAFLQVRLPQALAQVVPGFGSIAVDIVKWTSVVSFVGVQDLLYWGNVTRSATNETVLVYTLVAAIYIVLCVAVAGLFRLIEYGLPTSRAKRQAARARAQEPTFIVSSDGFGADTP